MRKSLNYRGLRRSFICLQRVHATGLDHQEGWEKSLSHFKFSGKSSFSIAKIERSVSPDAPPNPAVKSGIQQKKEPKNPDNRWRAGKVDPTSFLGKVVGSSPLLSSSHLFFPSASSLCGKHWPFQRWGQGGIHYLRPQYVLSLCACCCSFLSSSRLIADQAPSSNQETSVEEQHVGKVECFSHSLLSQDSTEKKGTTAITEVNGTDDHHLLLPHECKKGLEMEGRPCGESVDVSVDSKPEVQRTSQAPSAPLSSAQTAARSPYPAKAEGCATSLLDATHEEKRNAKGKEEGVVGKDFPRSSTSPPTRCLIHSHDIEKNTSCREENKRIEVESHVREVKDGTGEVSCTEHPFTSRATSFSSSTSPLRAGVAASQGEREPVKRTLWKPEDLRLSRAFFGIQRDGGMLPPPPPLFSFLSPPSWDDSCASLSFSSPAAKEWMERCLPLFAAAPEVSEALFLHKAWEKKEEETKRLREESTEHDAVHSLDVEDGTYHKIYKNKYKKGAKHGVSARGTTATTMKGSHIPADVSHTLPPHPTHRTRPEDVRVATEGVPFPPSTYRSSPSSSSLCSPALEKHRGPYYMEVVGRSKILRYLLCHFLQQPHLWRDAVEEALLSALTQEWNCKHCQVTQHPAPKEVKEDGHGDGRNRSPVREKRASVTTPPKASGNTRDEEGNEKGEAGGNGEGNEIEEMMTAIRGYLYHMVPSNVVFYTPDVSKRLFKLCQLTQEEMMNEREEVEGAANQKEDQKKNHQMMARLGKENREDWRTNGPSRDSSLSQHFSVEGHSLSVWDAFVVAHCNNAALLPSPHLPPFSFGDVVHHLRLGDIRSPPHHKRAGGINVTEVLESETVENKGVRRGPLSVSKEDHGVQGVNMEKSDLIWTSSSSLSPTPHVASSSCSTTTPTCSSSAAAATVVAPPSRPPFFFHYHGMDDYGCPLWVEDTAASSSATSPSLSEPLFISKSWEEYNPLEQYAHLSRAFGRKNAACATSQSARVEEGVFAVTYGFEDSLEEAKEEHKDGTDAIPKEMTWEKEGARGTSPSLSAVGEASHSSGEGDGKGRGEVEPEGPPLQCDGVGTTSLSVSSAEGTRLPSHFHTLSTPLVEEPSLVNDPMPEASDDIPFAVDPEKKQRTRETEERNEEHKAASEWKDAYSLDVFYCGIIEGMMHDGKRVAAVCRRRSPCPSTLLVPPPPDGGPVDETLMLPSCVAAIERGNRKVEESVVPVLHAQEVEETRMKRAENEHQPDDWNEGRMPHEVAKCNGTLLKEGARSWPEKGVWTAMKKTEEEWEGRAEENNALEGVQHSARRLCRVFSRSSSFQRSSPLEVGGSSRMNARGASPFLCASHLLSFADLPPPPLGYFRERGHFLNAQTGEKEDVHLSLLWQVFRELDTGDLLATYMSVRLRWWTQGRAHVLGSLLCQAALLQLFAARPEVMAITRPLSTFQQVWYWHYVICALAALAFSMPPRGGSLFPSSLEQEPSTSFFFSSSSTSGVTLQHFFANPYSEEAVTEWWTETSPLFGSTHWGPYSSTSTPRVPSLTEVERQTYTTYVPPDVEGTSDMEDALLQGNLHLHAMHGGEAREEIPTAKGEHSLSLTEARVKGARGSPPLLRECVLLDILSVSSSSSFSFSPIRGGVRVPVVVPNEKHSKTEEKEEEDSTPSAGSVDPTKAFLPLFSDTLIPISGTETTPPKRVASLLLQLPSSSLGSSFSCRVAVRAIPAACLPLASSFFFSPVGEEDASSSVQEAEHDPEDTLRTTTLQGTPRRISSTIPTMEGRAVVLSPYKRDALLSAVQKYETASLITTIPTTKTGKIRQEGRGRSYDSLVAGKEGQEREDPLGQLLSQSMGDSPSSPSTLPPRKRRGRPPCSFASSSSLSTFGFTVDTSREGSLHFSPPVPTATEKGVVGEYPEEVSSTDTVEKHDTSSLIALPHPLISTGEEDEERRAPPSWRPSAVEKRRRGRPRGSKVEHPTLPTDPSSPEWEHHGVACGGSTRAAADAHLSRLPAETTEEGDTDPTLARGSTSPPVAALAPLTSLPSRRRGRPKGAKNRTKRHSAKEMGGFEHRHRTAPLAKTVVSTNTSNVHTLRKPRGRPPGSRNKRTRNASKTRGIKKNGSPTRSRRSTTARTAIAATASTFSSQRSSVSKTTRNKKEELAFQRELFFEEQERIRDAVQEAVLSMEEGTERRREEGNGNPYGNAGCASGVASLSPPDGSSCDFPGIPLLRRHIQKGMTGKKEEMSILDWESLDS